ncbi:MAG: phosphate acyltransferase PlsX [Alphaproteobacteria bacterium]|nr:phosphate acyltransferase PlsX [Alphaproteobacteria bacterium]
MSASVTIALDAMGGDRAPAMVLRGADLALERYPDARFLLFGNEAQIAPILAKLPRLKQAAVLHHTDEVVLDDAKPSQALRTARRSSMRLAIEAVSSGAADGVVSAGNTGALMAMSKIVLKTLPGIDRPAIATLFPTRRGESVMLDLGANVECDADNLVQFALMGNVFARTVLGLAQPTVGLLNVGSEDLKGNDEVRAASARLRDGTIPLRFHGFIEGDDIAAGTVDVIVTDGFTGNVTLKAIEGIAKLFSEALRASFQHSMMARVGYVFARVALKKFAMRLDPRRHNGAMFLGLAGIAVKSHGSTDALGFANAIGVAIDLKINGFLQKISDELARLRQPETAMAGVEPQPSAAL